MLLDVPKAKPTPVRFSEAQEAILKRIAQVCGVNEVTVTRWAVEALGAYFDAHDGRLLLPLDFRQLFTVRPAPMILREPPQSRSDVRAGAERKSTRSRSRA